MVFIHTSISSSSCSCSSAGDGVVISGRRVTVAGTGELEVDGVLVSEKRFKNKCYKV